MEQQNSDNNDSESEGLYQNSSSHLILAICLTILGCSMIVGYNITVFSNPQKPIQIFLLTNSQINDILTKYFNISFNTTDFQGKELFLNRIEHTDKLAMLEFYDYKEYEYLYKIASSLLAIGGIFGSLLSGYIAENYGRRNGILLNNIICYFGGLVILFSLIMNINSLVYIARFILGVNCGMSHSLACLFLIEIAPKNIRASITSFHQLGLTIGMFLGNFITFPTFFGNTQSWHFAYALILVPAFFQNFLMGMFIPESPRYLFINSNLKKEAIKENSLYDLKFNLNNFLKEMEEEKEEFKEEEEGEESDIDEDYNNIDYLFDDKKYKENKINKTTVKKIIKFKYYHIFRKKYRKTLLLVCLLQVMQQMSGINVIIIYLTTILNGYISDNHMPLVVILFHSLYIISTLVGIILIEYFGRRNTFLFPTALLMLSLIGLSIQMFFLPNFTMSKYFLIFLISVFITSYSLGLGLVPNVILGELFCQGPRATAYSFSQCFHWLCYVFIFICFPGQIGGCAFLLFFVFVSLCWILFYFTLPETKNLTFKEISDNLKYESIFFLN